jgi:hypothetical protein
MFGVYHTENAQHPYCKINLFMLYRKIIELLSMNHTKSVSTLCGQNAEL